MKSRQNRAKIAPKNKLYDTLVLKQKKSKLNIDEIIIDILRKSKLDLSLTKIEELIEIYKLKNNLNFNLSRRSLQRTLQILHENKNIVRFNKARATLYSISNKTSSQNKPILASSHKPKKRETLNFTEYKPNFLESYIPQKKYFLDLNTRRQLHQIGMRAGHTKKNETYALKIYEQLLIDLSWSSSRLEGNTYSLLETEELIKNKTKIKGKNQIETQMILNHKEAVSFLIRNQNDIGFNSLTIRNIHALLSDSLLQDATLEGQIRKSPVGIDGSSYIPINIPQILEEQFELFIYKLSQIEDPFEQSFFSMVFIPYIQPFIDLNKRTSRIVANIAFIKNNLSPLSFNAIQRDEYLNSIIQIYERNDISLLKNLFIKSYLNSAQRYQINLNQLKPPHPLKIKYRSIIKSSVAFLIRNQSRDLNQLKHHFSFSELSKVDQKAVKKFIQDELKNVHEGNFAKFGVLPSEFYRWQKTK